MKHADDAELPGDVFNSREHVLSSCTMTSYGQRPRSHPRNRSKRTGGPQLQLLSHSAAAVPFREPTQQRQSLPARFFPCGNSGAQRPRLPVFQPPIASRQAMGRGTQPPLRRRDSLCFQVHGQPLLLQKIHLELGGFQVPPPLQGRPSLAPARPCLGCLGCFSFRRGSRDAELAKQSRLHPSQRTHRGWNNGRHCLPFCRLGHPSSTRSSFLGRPQTLPVPKGKVAPPRGGAPPAQPCKHPGHRLVSKAGRARRQGDYHQSGRAGAHPALEMPGASGKSARGTWSGISTPEMAATSRCLALTNAARLAATRVPAAAKDLAFCTGTVNSVPVT